MSWRSQPVSLLNWLALLCRLGVLRSRCHLVLMGHCVFGALALLTLQDNLDLFGVQLNDTGGEADHPASPNIGVARGFPVWTQTRGGNRCMQRAGSMPLPSPPCQSRMSQDLL